MKRRDFINAAVIGAAGVSIGTSVVTKVSGKGANDKIVLALIGSGGRGTGVIISTCKVNTNVEIKTVCDVNDSNAAKSISAIESALGYRPLFVRNMKEVFNDKDIDAVIIATPEHWHALATVWACQAGKDVYVEKNISLTIREGQKMIEAARKYDRIVQCGTQNRSAPYAFSAREYIRSGKLGTIVHVKSYCMLSGQKWTPPPSRDIPGGLNWDAWLGPRPYRPYFEKDWYDYWDFGGGLAFAGDASHVMDLARFVLGDPGHPRSVYGWGGNPAWGSKRETPEFQSIAYDFEKFTLTCDSGNATNYMKKTSNNIRMDPKLFPDWRTNATRTEIYGTEGLMYLGRHGGGWQVKGEDSKLVAEDGGIFPDVDHQRNFVESLRTRKKPNADLEQGQLSACLVHLGNIVYRMGNKQLFFDADNERFIDNDDANTFLEVSYRDNYKMPERV
jgi:predicted dehydrogenase